MRAQLRIVPLVVLAGGCASVRFDPQPMQTATVELTDREPGRGCCWLGSVVAVAEWRRGETAWSASEAIREFAAARGANYVVIEGFSAASTLEQSRLRMDGRLYRCRADGVPLASVAPSVNAPARALPTEDEQVGAVDR